MGSKQMFQTHMTPSAGFVFPGKAVVQNSLLHTSPEEVNSIHPLLFYSVCLWCSIWPDQCGEGSSGLKRVYVCQGTKFLTVQKDHIVSI